MTGFSESTENINKNRTSNQVTLTYAGLLRRVPKDLEYNWWMGEIVSRTATVRDMIHDVLESKEYARRFR